MAIDRETFARGDVSRQGVYFRVQPHFLLGVAQLRSGIADDNNADQIGPFRLKQAEWDANCNNDEFDIHFSSAQINSPLRQCAVFGLMAHRAFDAFVSANGLNPSAKELYLQLCRTPPRRPSILDFQNALDATASLLGPAASAVLDNPQSAPPAIAESRSINNPTGGAHSHGWRSSVVQIGDPGDRYP